MTRTSGRYYPSACIVGKQPIPYVILLQYGYVSHSPPKGLRGNFVRLDIGLEEL